MEQQRIKKFPISCVSCGSKKSVNPAIIHYTFKKLYNGKLYDLTIPQCNCIQCSVCQEVYFSNSIDEQVKVALDIAFKTEKDESQ